jgi:hypothetical protein
LLQSAPVCDPALPSRASGYDGSIGAVSALTSIIGSGFVGNNTDPNWHAIV